jgi:hypothetical protein
MMIAFAICQFRGSSFKSPWNCKGSNIMRLQRRSFIAGASLGVAGALYAGTAVAQAGGWDPLYIELMHNRDRYGSVCHLFGDSIMHGWALGAFWDGGAIDPRSGGIARGENGIPADHPLLAWHSPWAAMRQIARENGLGRLGIGYAGGAEVVTINALIDNGTIRPGDWLVFEDAGSHGGNPLAYFHKVRQWRQAAINRVATTCILMTMYDYNPEYGRYPDMEYDRKFPSGDGRLLSANDVIRMAANSVYWRSRLPLGKTILIDMNRRMDEWRNYCLYYDGVNPMHPDGIHPNCWGQWLMVREIFIAMGYPNLRTMKIDSVLITALKNWKTLGYGTRSNSWTQERSLFYARHLLQHA